MPALMCGSAGPSEPELNCTVPVNSAGIASPPPLNTTSVSFGRFSRIFRTSSRICGVVPIGGVAQLYFSGLARASATKSLIVFAGARLDHECIGRRCEFADRDEILVGIVWQLIVEPVIHRIGVGREQDRVAVRLGARRIFHADIAARPAAVLDDESFAGRLMRAPP